MPSTDPAQAEPEKPAPRAAPDQTYQQVMKALGKVVERNTQWLLEFGSWIFAGLIAFNLLVFASLLTVGPVDPAVIVSAAAFGLALPPDVAGFFLLRLVRDLEQVELEKEAAEALQEVGIDLGEQAKSPEALDAVLKRRTRVVLSYSYWILTGSALLTLIGMTAALWHMAWWIGVIFFAMVLVSSGIVMVAIVSSGSVFEPPLNPSAAARSRASIAGRSRDIES